VICSSVSIKDDPRRYSEKELRQQLLLRLLCEFVVERLNTAQQCHVQGRRARDAEDRAPDEGEKQEPVEANGSRFTELSLDDEDD
jgi:hypothetical protein